MRFNDLPDWYYPVRETLGAAILRNGNPVDAEKTFRDDLARYPRNPRSLFGLAKALEAQNRPVDATLVWRSFQEAWNGPANQLRLESF
jgi:cytochrome c-type biogenesis protein CcmH/NrfG